MYNFTDTQDLRLAVGYKATVDEKGAVQGVSHPAQLPVPSVVSHSPDTAVLAGYG